MTIKLRDDPQNVALTAGQSLRANAGATAMEAYTPSAGSDLAVTKNSTNGADQTIAAGGAVYIPGSFEIESGHSLEIAATACMEIG